MQVRQTPPCVVPLFLQPPDMRPREESASVGAVSCSLESALGDIVQGLFGYLQELDGYRVVCLRSAETAAVSPQQGGIQVIRHFDGTPSLIAHLEAVVPLLPPRSRRARVEAARPEIPLRPDLRPVIAHAGVWEARDVVVEVQVSSGPAAKQVEVGLFLSEIDVPELPLRMLATALRCHEFLVPHDIAPALQLPSEEVEGIQTIHQYLERAMPRNLAASQ